MPFKSDAQMGAAFGGHLGPEMQKKAPEWARETPNIGHLPKHVESELEMEDPVSSFEHPGCDDMIGDIFIVLKPSAESAPENLVHKTHAFGTHQFDPQTVHGVYGDEAQAGVVAETCVREMHKQMRSLEEKKDRVMEELSKHISRYQKEVNQHMKEAGAKPAEADHHHLMAEKKMATLKNLRDKHKMVTASKKGMPKPLQEAKLAKTPTKKTNK